MEEKNKVNDSVFEGALTTTDVARYCGVSHVHVNRWIKKGRLKCFRYPRGRYKITKEDFKDFLKRNNIPINESFFERKGRIKILIGEDNPEFAQGLKELLQGEYPEYKIEVVNDGYEVLLKMGEFRPDLLILDIRMPKIDGLEVCRRLKADSSAFTNTKIIAMTAHYATYSKADVLNTGADGYLIKPFKTDELLKSIDELIGLQSKTRS
ncbi:MAG: response regulator [Candidatus Glassbacteria bacterium]